jgi:hypothetical protein
MWLLNGASASGAAGRTKGAAGGGATGCGAGAAVVAGGGGGRSTGTGDGSAAVGAGAARRARGLAWTPGLEAANLVGETGTGAAAGGGADVVTGAVAAGIGVAPPTIWPAARDEPGAAGAGACEAPNPISRKIAAVPPAPTATAAISGVTRTSPRLGLPRVAWARRAPRSPMGMTSGGASCAAIDAGTGAGSGNGSGAATGGATAKGVGSGSGCAMGTAAGSGSGGGCGANDGVSATAGAGSGSGSGCATGAAGGGGIL